MPYIEEQDRADAATRLDTVGDLTYALTALCEQYRTAHGDKFQTFAEIDGALGCTGREFYRRVVAPYEDQKIELNGDVYRPVRPLGQVRPPRT